MSRVFLYRIADQLIRSEVVLKEAESFRSDEKKTPHIHVLKKPELVSTGQTLFDNEAWIGEKMRQVHCKKDDGYHLEVEGIGKSFVSPDGSRIEVDAKIPEGPLLSEFVLGPTMMLALATLGVFSLHASALEIEGRAFLCAGNSAAGKSTLARELPFHLPHCKRIGDDVLPTRICSDRLEVLPHFPQLKLPPEDQWPQEAPLALQVDTILFLNKTEHENVQIEALGPSDFLRKLIANTVASRLFDEILLTRHLQWCRGATERTLGYSLSYPHREPAIEQTASILEERFLYAVQ